MGPELFPVVSGTSGLCIYLTEKVALAAWHLQQSHAPMSVLLLVRLAPNFSLGRNQHQTCALLLLRFQPFNTCPRDA